jgi:hypothetical protein
MSFPAPKPRTERFTPDQRTPGAQAEAGDIQADELLARAHPERGQRHAVGRLHGRDAEQADLQPAHRPAAGNRPERQAGDDRIVVVVPGLPQRQVDAGHALDAIVAEVEAQPGEVGRVAEADTPA